jgi:hypothetical protein
MSFPVYSGLSHSTIETYHLATTPETIVISPTGEVLGDWQGAYTGATKTAVERFFNISFPEPSAANSTRNFDVSFVR